MVTLVCSKCPQKRPFPNENALRMHTEAKHASGVQCAVCRKRFQSAAGLKQHTADAHRATHTCDDCGSAHETAQALDQHVAAKHSKSYACKHCSRAFKTLAALKQHIEASHPVKFPCNACGAVFGSQQACNQHAKTEHKPTIYSCNQHAKTEHKPTIYSCNHCTTVFSTLASIDHHNRTAHTKFPCTSCDRVFDSQGGLQIHTASKHPQYTCTSCESLFGSKEALEEHASAHILPCSCSICNRACSSQRSLDEHAATEHNCPVLLDSGCSTPVSLLEHVAEHELLYSCSPCEVKYRTQDELEQHFADTSDDLHPTCRRCPLAFKDSDEHAKHMEVAHPKLPCNSCGEILYIEEFQRHYLESPRHPTCTICNVGFVDQRTFATHGAFLHPEEHCHLCRFQFDSAEALQRHQRHFVTHPKCMPCDMGFADAEAHQIQHMLHHQHEDEEVDQNTSPACESAHSYVVSGYQVNLATSPPSSDGALSSCDQQSTQLHLQGRQSADNQAKPVKSSQWWQPYSRGATPINASSIPLPRSLSSRSTSSSHRGSSRRLSSTGSWRASIPTFTSPRTFADLSRLHPLAITEDDDKGDVEDFHPQSDPVSRSSPVIFQKGETGIDQWPSLNFSKPTYPIVGVSQFLSPPLSASRLPGNLFFTESHMDPYRDMLSPSSPMWPESLALTLVPQERNGFGSYQKALDIEEEDDDDRSSLSAKSPQLMTPPMRLPSQYGESPLSSQWSPESVRTSISSNQSPEVTTSQIPDPSVRVTAPSDSRESVVREPSPNQNGFLSVEVMDVSVPPSPLTLISPESAGLFLSTTLTPESFRNTRDCPSDVQVSPQTHTNTSSPAHSPAVPSPVLSSMNSHTTRSQKREVRFEDSILSEKFSDVDSVDSFASSPKAPIVSIKPWTMRDIDPSRRPSPVPRIASSLKASRLPRRACTPQNLEESSSSSSSSFSGHSTVPRYHCRICHSDPCEDLTSTICGHLFCNSCITEEVVKKSCCPVCKAATLLYCLFRIDAS